MWNLVKKNDGLYYGMVLINVVNFFFSPADTVVYDDACHLKKYAANPIRSQLTETAKKLGTMSMSVDKFHFKNHVDKWCKVHCNPYNNIELEVKLYF